MVMRIHASIKTQFYCILMPVVMFYILPYSQKLSDTSSYDVAKILFPVLDRIHLDIRQIKISFLMLQ